MDDLTYTPTVYVVDDDPAVCKSMEWLLESAGHNVAVYPCAEDFLNSYRAGCPGCVVLDVRMPGMSGLELQNRLSDCGVDIPLIIVTGYGDVPMAVRAMGMGAVDFMEKPFSDKILLDRVEQALDRDRVTREANKFRTQVLARMASLTPRESQVLEMIMDGMINRQIADKLSVKTKTVEAHRSRVMDKMQATTVAHLVGMVLEVRPEASKDTPHRT